MKLKKVTISIIAIAILIAAAVLVISMVLPKDSTKDNALVETKGNAQASIGADNKISTQPYSQTND